MIDELDKEIGPDQPERPEVRRDEAETFVQTPEREKFDQELAERLTRKNLEIIELRIALARADEARRSYLNVLVFVLMMAGWLYIWRTTLPE